MASAAPAYRYDAYPDFEYERPSRQSDIRAIRTGGVRAEQPSPSVLVTIAKMAAVVFVVAAALCFGRIALTNATVTTLIESDALSTQISEARSTGISLEMEQSVLSSPSAIKAGVKRLNMAAPAYVETIALDPDVVAVTDAGELSLSDTVKNLVEIRG